MFSYPTGTGGFCEKRLRKTTGSDFKTVNGAVVTVTKPRRYREDDVDYLRSMSHPETRACSSCYKTCPVRGPASLSNFLGSYRILQEHKGGHRYTTDDICTAWVARNEDKARHLDLGTGGGSVALALRWFCKNSGDALSDHQPKTIGIEARKDAVEYARFSARYNLGDGVSSESYVIERGDFRDLEVLEGILERHWGLSRPTLVTGTPPYFAVSYNPTNEETTILEGAMPTNMQSSPARCEFRGGVDDYIRSALSCLSPGGSFVVCVNWLNKDRVYSATSAAGGHVSKVYEFKGREGKPTLFGVWVIKPGKMGEREKEMKETIVVRKCDGTWTPQYVKVMKDCGIPTLF